MSTEWAVQTIERVQARKRLDKKNIGGDNEQSQDKRIFYCTNCKVVFQPTIFAERRFCDNNEIEVYIDFPTIGKERVGSCARCE